jgi:tetratricopeptide (TPR) repeat protein/predicted Ser/Thr protein kinase
VIDSRWTQIEQLFFEAAELDAADRVAFLDHACGSDLELRREIETLLATDATACYGAGSLIEGTIQNAAGALFAAEVSADRGGAGDSMKGTRLGTWVILWEIGRGGMGAVYLAERADADFRKQVAIKLVKRGIDTDAVLKRFLQERQILAGLEHPNIAGLLDGGTSPDGRPYFVMEYVEGVPIQKFCEERKLTLRERCELFRRVCEPVSYAHRNLVIHRDLKPANILVTPDGSPKLLDFGIARLLSQEAGDNTVGLVGDSFRPFTPAYASPEQLSGEAVNTATDIYSLGAVLFQVLTGKRPERNLAENAAKEFDKPSSCVASKALARALTGDLDNIVLKATHPEASRRYQSVDQFSDDLRRHLAGLTVMAREENWLYSAGKFIRRNRLPVLAGALLALTLTGGVASVLWQTRQTRIQRQRAEERLDELVELANKTVLQVHTSIERLPGATAARREIVQSTLAYLDRLNAETGNDKRILSAMASAYIRLARIEGDPLQPNLGNYAGAEQSYRKAEKILDGLIKSDPDNVDLRLAMVDCSQGLGEVLDATARRTETIEETERGLQSADRVLARDPKNLAARKSSSLLHLLRASANSWLINLPPARAEMLQQLPVNQQLAADCPQDADCLLPLASTFSQLGTITSREGDLPGAIAWYRKSVTMREQLYALHPNNVAVQRDLMLAYGHVGDTYGSPFLLSLGDSHGALAWYRKAAQIADAMVVSDPTDRQARADLGIVLQRIGSVLEAPGERAESLAALGRSAATLEPLLVTTPGDVSTASQLTLVYEYEGRRFRSMREYSKALASYQRSVNICVNVLNGHPDHRSCQRQLTIDDGAMAGLYAETGDRATAVRLAASSLELARALVASGNRVVSIYLPRALGWNGDVYRSLASDPNAPAAQRAADWAEARSWYGKSVAEWKKIDPEIRSQFVQEANLLGNSLAASERELAKLR